MTEKFVSPEKPPEGLDRELLTVLIEECAEVITECTDIQKRATKMLRFGLTEVQPGQELTNSDRLSDEIGDVFAVVNRLEKKGLISMARITAAIENKSRKLDKYLQSEG